MKKLTLLLLLVPIFVFGQIKEFDSDEELLVFDDGKQYNSTKVYYKSKYSFQRDQLSFKDGYQSVYIKMNRVKEFGDLYEKGMNKAFEWAKIARENGVPELKKSMDWKFRTDGGMLYDASSFESSGKKDGEFEVTIRTDKKQDYINYRYRVFQTDEYIVYTAFADLGLVILSNEEDLNAAKKFIDFCKNYETYVNSAIDKFNSKDEMFN
tara:strand:+ start:507 stop:1133 length:627 start_codon:yes stop_codon:yes gene_type:complete